MSRLPQLGAFLRLVRPFERTAAIRVGECGNGFDLLGDARRRAVELEEQRRHFGIFEFGPAIDRRHLLVVEDFDAGKRNAALDRLDDGIDRTLQGLEPADRRHDLFGYRMEAQADLGNNA